VVILLDWGENPLGPWFDPDNLATFLHFSESQFIWFAWSANKNMWPLTCPARASHAITEGCWNPITPKMYLPPPPVMSPADVGMYIFTLMAARELLWDFERFFNLFVYLYVYASVNNWSARHRRRSAESCSIHCTYLVFLSKISKIPLVFLISLSHIGGSWTWPRLGRTCKGCIFVCNITHFDLSVQISLKPRTLNLKAAT